MHVAVCDDNVADRKQMERLLKRESDRRALSSEGLFIDSFGNSQSLLHNSMQYDVFYVDICRTEGQTGADAANSLLSAGGGATIVLCCSDIDYRKFPFPPNVLFLDKPIKAAELSDSIDYALSIKLKALPLIELRMEVPSSLGKDTIYVTEPDIMYAVEGGRTVTVTLADGRKITVVTSTANFFAHVENFPSFFSPSRKVVINGRHIKEIQRKKAVMPDGAVFRIGLYSLSYAKYIYSQYNT
jgi:DNA-binding LytR/AlgR family response regulator